MKFQQSKKTWIIIAVIVIVVVALLLLFFLTKDKLAFGAGGGTGAGTNITSNVEATARLIDVAGDISSLREELDGLASGIG